MADYLVQEDGSSKFTLEDASGSLLLESSVSEIAVPFIGSVTAVYTPPDIPEVTAPFIASVTALYAPTYGFSGSTVITSPGTFDWTCPAGVTQIAVEAIGGGGGGSGGGISEGYAAGGGGAYALRAAMPVTPGNTYTFVVGSGGPGSINDGAGTDGTDSSFTGDGGVQVVAQGGKAGNNLSAGQGGQASGSTGDASHVFSGGNGGAGVSGIHTGGSGGGASGNRLATGANGGRDVGGTGVGAAGGVGADGGGSGGTGGNAGGFVGGDGSVPGGGGGGANGDGSVPKVGGAGAPGEIIINCGILAPFIASNTVVYTPTMPIQAPFIGSVTVVYTPTIPTQVAPPFIPSVTIVYTPTLPEVHAPFISSRTHVWAIMSLFDPNRRYGGQGNGGEQSLIRLNANGVTDTATLAANLGVGTGAILSLTGDSAFPATHPFIVTIDSEQIYVSQLTPGNYLVRARARGNTTVATHTAGATVSWGDSYDQALVATSDINHNFTADINSTGSFIYPGWLICFDSSQAYLDDGSRYPMHVTEVVGVFDAGAGVSGSSRLDGPQPNAICTPTGASDDCPAALSNPARIATDIVTGDVAVIRYTNPEAVVLDLGPRSASLQSWFGLKRVDSSDVDVTFTDPDGYVVDTIPSGPGPGPFTGSVNGEWDPAPLVVGIAPAASIADPANAPIYMPNAEPYTTVTLPGADRYFTDSIHFNEQGWPMCCLTVRQGRKRVPFWQSWDWHDFSYVYSGFGVDCNYAQILINRNGVLFNSVPAVDLPGPQDIDGPDAVWDDGGYAFGASWYVVIFSTPYIVGGPPIGGSTSQPPGGETIPTVSWPSGGGSPPTIGGGGTPPPPIEGGSGGNIGGSEGLHVWQTS